MSVRSKLRAIVGTVFQFGKSGAQIKSASSSVIEARNAADDGYAVVRGATGSGSNDLTTLDQVNLAGVPIGTVIGYAKSTPPTGCLECNGAAISRTTYSALFAVIGTTWGAGNGSTTFNLPDFRGEFVRGWDNGRGVDSGRTFASYQADRMQGHGHSLYGQTSTNQSGTAVSLKHSSGTRGVAGYYYSTSSGWDYVTALGSGTTVPVGEATTMTNGTPRTGNDTVPRNKALLYAIKY